MHMIFINDGGGPRSRSGFAQTKGINEACQHYMVVSKIEWQPFWLANQLYPQNDWAGWRLRVNNDVFAQAYGILELYMYSQTIS